MLERRQEILYKCSNFSLFLHPLGRLEHFFSQSRPKCLRSKSHLSSSKLSLTGEVDCPAPCSHIDHVPDFASFAERQVCEQTSWNLPRGPESGLVDAASFDPKRLVLSQIIDHNPHALLKSSRIIGRLRAQALVRLAAATRGWRESHFFSNLNPSLIFLDCWIELWPRVYATNKNLWMRGNVLIFVYHQSDLIRPDVTDLSSHHHKKEKKQDLRSKRNLKCSHLCSLSIHVLQEHVARGWTDPEFVQAAGPKGRCQQGLYSLNRKRAWVFFLPNTHVPIKNEQRFIFLNLFIVKEMFWLVQHLQSFRRQQLEMQT